MKVTGLNSTNEPGKKDSALLSSPSLSPPEKCYVVLCQSWNWKRTADFNPFSTKLQRLCPQTYVMFANLHVGFNLLSLIAMAKRSLLFLYIFQGLLPLSFGQQRTVGPWRHRIQWENNGQVYSLMSTGLEYQAPYRSTSQSRVYVSSRRDGTGTQMSGARRRMALVRTGPNESRQFRTDNSAQSGLFTPGHDVRPYAPVNRHASGFRQRLERPTAAVVRHPGARHFNGEFTRTTNASSPGSSTDFSGGNGGSVTVDNTALHTRIGEPGPGAQNQQLRTGPEVTPVSRQPAQTDRSISAHPSGLENESEAPAVFPALTEEKSNGEDMVNDDPRNPLKNHRNSVFYNMYPTRGRSAARTPRPPGTGYGTGYFQNGRSSVPFI